MIARSRPMRDGPPLFELEAASLAIGGRVLLQPLSLVLPAGRVIGLIGLIGHNGSGKSTLVKLLARQHQPTVGSIQLQGQGVALYPEREFARHVAYLPQQPAPAAGLLARELVAFGRYPWHGALGRFGPPRPAEGRRGDGADRHHHLR
jgi:iron-chelate-transporting ATPase